MKRGTVGLIVTLVVLTVATMATGTTTAIGLPLAAAAAVVSILASRPRGWAWRLAAAGSTAWFVEEAIWAVKRMGGVQAGTLATDITYFGGAVLWGAALLTLHGRRTRTPLWILVLPAVAAVGWLLVVRAPDNVALQFPFIDAVLLLLAVPALEPALRGRASEGRVLIVLAFFIRAIGSASFAWLFDGSALEEGAAVVWLLSFGALALGARLEISGEPSQLFVASTSVVTLQAVAGTVIAAVLRLGRPLDSASTGVLVLLAYCQLVILMLIVYTQRMRTLATDRELTAWGELVADLGTGDGTQDDRAQVQSRFLRALRERLPGLRGMVLHEEQDVLVGERGTYSYPLVAGGTEVARLQFAGQPRELDVLDAVAPFIAGRLRQSMLAAAWADQALSDPLTGILNRRGFALRSGRLVGRARADAVPMCVVMLDIDRFKRVNDFYGHGVGDEALQALSQVLRRNLRPDDLAVRWGGEEFVVVLFDADRDVAVDVIRRVRAELKEHKVPPIEWSLTFSAGLAGGSVPAGLTELESWIEEADAALRRAKAAGRDRYEVVA
ncbi:MAG TPA: GGDEF domain-containing protein [Trueperaceae bacterium]|nr:GGDEF domain-containing protein [Trueperaceae bacterium]